MRPADGATDHHGLPLEKSLQLENRAALMNRTG
jgi:hypothetical protein